MLAGLTRIRDLFLSPKQQCEMQESADNKEAQAKAKLEDYVKNYKIFIDTCSLLHGAADRFWRNIAGLLHMHSNKIIVPTKVIEELQKHANNPDKPEIIENAKNALKAMKQLQSANLIEIRGEKTDTFADNLFLTLFTKFRLHHKLLLITQDTNLAKDVSAINQGKSVNAKQIRCEKINQYGFLSSFTAATQQQEAQPSPQNRRKTFSYTLTTLKNDNLGISRIPRENEFVYLTPPPPY